MEERESTKKLESFEERESKIFFGEFGGESMVYLIFFLKKVVVKSVFEFKFICVH